MPTKMFSTTTTATTTMTTKMLTTSPTTTQPAILRELKQQRKSLIQIFSYHLNTPLRKTEELKSLLPSEMPIRAKQLRNLDCCAVFFFATTQLQSTRKLSVKECNIICVFPELFFSWQIRKIVFSSLSFEYMGYLQGRTMYCQLLELSQVILSRAFKTSQKVTTFWLTQKVVGSNPNSLMKTFNEVLLLKLIQSKSCLLKKYFRRYLCLHNDWLQRETFWVK